MQPLQTIVLDARRAWRLGATIFVVFGVLAVAVAAVGLYGAFGYTVVQRSHELWVRVALGARPSSILRLVMGQSARVALVGTAIGMAAAVLASRWIQPLSKAVTT